MERTVLLQTAVTHSKLTTLRSFSKAATEEANRLLLEREGCHWFNEFWHKAAGSCKERTGFNSQVVCDLVRGTWRKQRTCH